MIDVKHIVLSEDELSRCRQFAEISAPNQQSIEFGQRTTKSRPTSEIARDNLIGKIAEVAFSKMMKENYGIDVPLDFNFYPRGQWDNQDAEINGWRIDVKGTRKGGRWMLIEWNKLSFRQKDNNLSHVFMMFSVDWDREADEPVGTVSYEGAVSLGKLKASCETTLVLRKGTVLPGTHTRLQADNYGIRFGDLYKHLNHLVERMLHSPPPIGLTENYVNPYTGKTTKEIVSEAEANRNIPVTDLAIEEKAEIKESVSVNTMEIVENKSDDEVNAQAEPEKRRSWITQMIDRIWNTLRKAILRNESDR